MMKSISTIGSSPLIDAPIGITEKHNNEERVGSIAIKQARNHAGLNLEMFPYKELRKSIAFENAARMTCSTSEKQN
jgi:hypothetical protein